MKCSECPKTIPATRRREKPHARTCSDTCSGIRQGRLANERGKSYLKRVRGNLEEIRHVALVPGTELKVRKGHVVGLEQPEGEWQLVVVIRATFAGRAIHACPASAWDPELKARSDTRLAGATTVAVLPPEWAEDQARAAKLEKRQFPYLEDLRQALTQGKKKTRGRRPKN